MKGYIFRTSTFFFSHVVSALRFLLDCFGRRPISSPLFVQWRKNVSTLTILSATSFTVRGIVDNGVSVSFVNPKKTNYDYRDHQIAASHWESLRNWIRRCREERSSMPVAIRIPVRNLFIVSKIPKEYLQCEKLVRILSEQNDHVYRSNLYPSTLNYHLAYEK